MKKVFSVLISNFILAIVFANKVFAQADFGVNDLGDSGTFLGTRSLQDTIVGVINIFLGFLGILATLLILYAGFLWMTSNGNKEKIDRAKLLISSAVIGLVIILSAYAISQFVLRSLVNETTSGGGGGGGGGGGLPTCPEPANGDDSQVCSLSRTVGPVGSGITIRGWHFDTDGDGAPGIGRVEIGGVLAEIVQCNSSQLWNDKKVKVKIPDTLLPGTYPVALFNDLGNESLENPHFEFTVSSGTSLVNIDCLVPDEVAAIDLQLNPQSVQIIGDGFTDTQDITDTVSINAWVAGVETAINLNVTSWSDLEINVDVPANVISSDIIVDIAGITDREFFTVGCGASADCNLSSGCCNLSNNSCVSDVICNGTTIIPSSNTPVIQSVSPEDGEEGSLVTIFGYNFGNIAGTVTFDGVPGILPSTLNAACTPDVWTDEYIIMGIADLSALDDFTGVVDIVVTQDALVGGETSDPYPGFDVNDVVRPGICALGATDGFFGDSLTVAGINFANSDDAYFDTIVSYQTTFNNLNSIDTEVPNVVGNLGVVIQSVANIDSNAFPFEVLATTGGNPVITELSPDNGPVDSYVTIMGSNFGDNTGNVFFDDGGTEVLGDFDFPAQCGDYWFDDHIIVKVPSAFVAGSYPIIVERNGDLARSNNNFDFTVNNTPLGPQICAITPNNGPIGQANVKIFGENFGDSSNPGSVTFYDSIGAPVYAAWNANQILNIEIPVGASTGLLTVEDDANNISNGIAFDVGACTSNSQCGGGNECCTGEVGNYCAPVNTCDGVLNTSLYSWEVRTQAEPFGLVYNYSCSSDLQSPSPWVDKHEWIDPDTLFTSNPDSLDAFIDSNISALFTRDVNDLDFNNTNIVLQQCTDSSCTNYVTALSGTITIINQNSDREGFVFDPDLELISDTWYEVVLGTFRAAVGEDAWTPDPVLDEWTFKTRDSGILCEVTSVAVTPQNADANMLPGEEKNFNASPLANNCNICGGNYDWQWSLDSTALVPIPPYVPLPAPPGVYSSFVGPEINTAINSGYTRLEGGPSVTELTTNPNYIDLIAENTTYGISSDSYPVILAPVIRVGSKVPSCTDSCPTAEIWVDFNTRLQALNIDDFAIYACSDPTCSGWDDTISLTTGLNSYWIISENVYRVELDHLDFNLNTGYKIFIYGSNGPVVGSITNIYGYTLVNDETWDFSTGANDCVLSDVDITPINYIAYNTNNINYIAYPQAETSCGLQAITCATCTYDWTSSAPAVASITTGSKTVAASPLIVGTPSTTNIEVIVTNSAGDIATNITPLNVDIDGVAPNITTLNIDSHWPACDGACDNSVVGLKFDTSILEATLAGQYSITDITDPLNPVVSNGYTLVGGDTLTIDHTPFVLGSQYRVNILTGIQSSVGDNLSAPLQWVFTVGEAECQITSVNVNPPSITAGASQGISYNAETMSNTVSCGNLPVYCATCTYDWSDNPDLGNFDNISIQNPIFTTTATVLDGDTSVISVDVVDQGSTFSDTGDLAISIGSSLASNVILSGYFPLGNPNNMCINLVPYAEFDITNGNLDRQSFIDNAVFYQDITSLPFVEVPFYIRFAQLDPLNPNILTAMYEPNNILDSTSSYFVGFKDPNLILTEDGNPISIGVPSLSIALNGDEGWYFITGADACSIHSVEIIPQNDLFTCIDDIDCVGDESAAAGNQHEYESIAYDIQKNILASSANTYAWTVENSNIVSPDNFVNSSMFGTAGNENGITNLSVQVYLNTEPSNVLGDATTVELATCQNPWPDLATYPWNTLGDMNFSTYYCTDSGLPGVTDVGIPNEVNSPNSDVLKEYVTTISYPIVLNNPNSYLGSLAYFDDDNSWTKKLASLFKIEKTRGQINSAIDIIAFRVMKNPEHLSVLDWYNKTAPNVEQIDSAIQINGYEALQVGSSIYIAAANIEGGDIYTNIYIIAHNIGANNTTLEIYNQMVSNFKLNVNLPISSNTCNVQVSLSCSSDFDCPNYCDNGIDNNEVDCVAAVPLANWRSDTCDSQELKLRRDTKRLGDLVNINDAILAYGESHKACSNNSLISCETNTDCPSAAACVAYYPSLNAGSYLNGASNSRWPSWRDAFTDTLNRSIAEDPINLFNGCSDPNDPSTCWNETDLEFICPANSLVYMYNIAGIGQSYDLSAQFEYDMQSTAETFALDLDSPVILANDVLNLLDLTNSSCTATPINAPGASTSPYCGNGLIDTDYCTNISYDNQADCVAASANWIVSEECDNNFHAFACSEVPSNVSTSLPPIIPLGAGVEWWNEQTIGCNPPGTIDSITNELIECTWYRPQVALTAAQCGGYCGDGDLQQYYENCDGSVPADGYTCADPADPLSCDNGCQVVCTDSVTTDIYPAAQCGDGILSEGIEQCDSSASPNGTLGWDCTEGGAIACNNSCGLTCSVGVPYQGICGDGVLDVGEECDYANYDPATPDSGDSYGCTLTCEFNNEVCGDGLLQYEYQELCDYGNNLYDTPEPLFSDEFNQYLCRDSGVYTVNSVDYGACTATLDGYCGDGKIQDGNLFPDYGEKCDPGSPWDGIPQIFPSSWLPAGSSSSFQYLCDVDCSGTTGGYCGDGSTDTEIDPLTSQPYEVCDGLDYPNRPIPYASNINNTYTCQNDCGGGDVVDGGYCGDGIVNELYYEGCDDASFSYPWPLGTNLNNFSSQINQYTCNSCINFGGYCGNGIVDGACVTSSSDSTPVICTGWQCEVSGVVDFSIRSELDCNNTPSGAWLPSTAVGCTQFECEQQSGWFSPYEQCDTGFSPSSVIDKNIDIAYIFDTSGSMEFAAAQLCKSTATVVNTLKTDHPDIDFRITIFPMGDGDLYNGGAELTSTLSDNSREFFWIEKYDPDPNLDQFNYTVDYDLVFDALYTDCLASAGGLLKDITTGETIDPRVRYLSLYDDATNDINGTMDIYAGDGPVGESCAAFDATENWGYAMKRVIERYNWLPGYNRIVVPVSDEYAVCGNGNPTSLSANEDYDDSDGVYDILVEAVKAANIDENNHVYINPVLLSGATLSVIGEAMADATRGLFTSSSSGWEVQTLRVVNSSFCDGAGGNDGTTYGGPDGHMDCRIDDGWVPLPPPNQPPPPAIDSLLTASSLEGSFFSYAITAAPSPIIFYASGLPNGLSLDSSTGVISGTITTAGVYNIQISAGSGSGIGPEATLTLTVTSLPPPVITSSLIANGTSAINFSYFITADNSPASFAATGLPTGFTVDALTGEISGATGAGTYNIVISATNSSGTANETLVLTIASLLPVINSPLTASVASGASFSYTIRATNNPINFKATGLPVGLTVSLSGIISGSTTVAGDHNISISATNSTGTDTEILVLTVIPDVPVITSTLAISRTASNYFTYLITADNSPASFDAVGLPTGMSINPTTGLIYGSTSLLGTHAVTITASNVTGTDTEVLNISISACRTLAQSCSASSLCCSSLGCSAGSCAVLNNDGIL